MNTRSCALVKKKYTLALILKRVIIMKIFFKEVQT